MAVQHLSQILLDALADRLLARAASNFFEASPQVRSDMLLASACVRHLARTTSLGGIDVEVWTESQ
jgi:hypothetical protein